MANFVLGLQSMPSANSESNMVPSNWTTVCCGCSWLSIRQCG